MQLNNYNLSQYKPYVMINYPLPKGKYTCILQETEKSTKNDESLHLVWEVKGGPYVGCRVHSWFNMETDGGRKAFALLAAYMGADLDSLKDSDELVGRECTLTVENKNGWNQGTRFSPANSELIDEEDLSIE